MSKPCRSERRRRSKDWKPGGPPRLALAAAGKASQGSEPYKVFTTKQAQKMVYCKGKPVRELVDPDGNVHVMQAHEEQFPIDSLPRLGQKLKKLPKAWQYRTRILTEDLVLDLLPVASRYQDLFFVFVQPDPGGAS
jgi:hypothetical protein